ncbi:helix-turn-helix transcriptional regulator [Caballeronia sp. GAFFF3]|uniref:helix-turn-helix transcriptional regulator n=1 Tax=Caballeronia sp. GAFFF3 TaxID=2921759 RepID=UPI002028B4FE|nr:helix-turn-helix transcriptional regulator [Caballeronia sp. GAFFF3]
MATVQIRVVQWDDKPDTMGAKLRGLRRDAGLSREQVAKETGLGLKTIGDLEIGTYSPSWRTFTKLARFFNVSLDWLAE